MTDPAPTAASTEASRGRASENAAGAPPIDAAPVDIGELLDELAIFVRRYVVMSQAQADAIALWIVHTYALDAAEATPYLSICSPEKRSGKSRLLEVLAVLVAEPLKAAGVTEAALFRSISTKSPTVLMDEVDAIFGPKAMNHEDLRALLNAGYQRGTGVLRCVGDGARQTVVEFQVFCPKALAGIGELPDTIADRSVPIRLKRRGRDEELAKFRRRHVASEAVPLRERSKRWAEASMAELEKAEPVLPDELDDRAQDAVEPLLAIAEAAGTDWTTRAHRAFVELRTGEEVDEADSIGIRLLGDVRRVFLGRAVDRISTAELLDALAADEEAPWADWRGAGRMTARALAGLLRRYGIRASTVWLPDGRTSSKGFKREQFEDAWSRYVTSYPSGPSGPASHAALSPVFYPSGEPEPDGSKESANPHGQRHLTDLTDRTAEGSEETLLRELEELVAAGVLSPLEGTP